MSYLLSCLVFVRAFFPARTLPSFDPLSANPQDLIGRRHQDKEVLEFVKGMSEKHPWFPQLGNHEIMQVDGIWGGLIVLVLVLGLSWSWSLACL